VRDEVVLGQPAEPQLVDDQMRERRGGRPAAEQGAERLALVLPEA
jgi:hypothetical protein